MVDGVYGAGRGEGDGEEEDKGKCGGVEDAEEDCLDPGSTGHGQGVEVVTVAIDMLALRGCDGVMHIIFPAIKGHDVSYASARIGCLSVVVSHV